MCKKVSTRTATRARGEDLIESGDQDVKRRRTELTIQTHEVVVLHGGEAQTRAWCRQCREERVFLLPEAAARLAGVSVRTIYRRVEEKRLHFLETPDGRVRVCVEAIAEGTGTLEGGTKK